MSRVIYYYQTPTTLTPLINANIPNLNVIVSSLHFGFNTDETPYIHLNNYPPNDSKYTCMWQQIERLAEVPQTQIHVMLGGAGGAYEDLFENYDQFYPLLRNFLKTKQGLITGINFDIEEQITVEQIERLMTQVHHDFPSLELSLAPVLEEVLNPTQPGVFSGFAYQTLFDRLGQLISFVNVQMYNLEFTHQAFSEIIDVWTLPFEKLVPGICSIEYPGPKIETAFQELQLIHLLCPTMGGAFIWEYSNAPPNAPQDPSEWGKAVARILNSQ